jgi:8-oxo-dGTP pyrophosphatase MutT (NUDIX family)
MGKNTQLEKTGSGRILKTKYSRHFSSGGIVFKENGKDFLWLIKKTAASNEYPNQYWMLPKGWIDDEGERVPGPMASGKIKADENSLQAAALREVREETGIEAVILKKIGTYKYSYTDPVHGDVLKFVTFYLMKYKKDLPEGFDFETSEIKWLSYQEAYKTLSFSGEKQMLKKALLITTPSERM